MLRCLADADQFCWIELRKNVVAADFDTAHRLFLSLQLDLYAVNLPDPGCVKRQQHLPGVHFKQQTWKLCLDLHSTTYDKQNGRLLQYVSYRSHEAMPGDDQLATSSKPS